MSEPNATRRRRAGRPTTAVTTREGSSRRRGNRAQRAEAPRDGREDGARRLRRNAGLHGIPAGALAPGQDEQRDRAHQPQDQEEDKDRRGLPRRQLGPHAGDGETEVHSGARAGQGAVPGHVQTGGDGRAEGKGGGLEEGGPRTAKSICERILTVPRRLYGFGHRQDCRRGRHGRGNHTATPQYLPSAKGTESMAAPVPTREIRGIVSYYSAARKRRNTHRISSQLKVTVFILSP